MKRKLLFAALCAVLSTIFGLKAADLPTSGSGEFFLRNVGTGTYLKGDAYWGTKAVVWDDPYAVTLTYVNDGVYTIQSQQNNGGQKQYFTSGDDLYVDGDACNMTFTEVDAENHYYTINNGTGNLYATEVTEDGATLYKVMAGDVSTDYAKWQIISRAELVAAFDGASPSNPVDATFCIKDAGIDVKSVNAGNWSKTNVDLDGGGNAGHSAESWNKANFNLSQTVTGLPNGKYKVTCHGYYRYNIEGGGNNNSAAVAAHGNGSEVLNAIFFAGAKETPLMSVAGDAGATAFCLTMPQEGDNNWFNGPNNQWQAAACFTKGYYLNTLNDVVVTDGTLTIGVKKTTQAYTDWAVFDEFKLYYLGEDPSIYQTAYADAVVAAKAALDNEGYAVVTGDEKAALAKAIDDYSTVEETIEAYKAAISALSAATTAFTAAKDDYDALVAAKAANAERSYKYADADKKAAAEASLTVEATSAADAKEKATAIWTAFRKYADSHALAEGVEGAINMTDYIVNPNAAEAIAEPWTVVKGEGSGGALQILDGEPLTDGDGNTYKYFDGGDWGANAWDVALKQTITLPAGKYMITASGRASGDVQLSLLVGEEKTAIPAIGATGGLFGNGWDDASKDFELATESDVVIGVQGVTSVVHNWMSFTRFRLVCLEKSEAPAPTTYNVVVVEREHGTVVAEPTTAEAGATVTIKVTPDEGYMVDEVHVTYGDDQTIDWESLDMETLTGTIIMPAADVNVLFTFKEVEEKTYAAVKMTWVDYANPETSVGEVETAQAGYNKIANGEVGFGNTSWPCNWITYLQVDASEYKGAVKSAVLTFEGSGSTDSKRVTSWGVGYNSSEWSADLTYGKADKSITVLNDVQTGTSTSATAFEEYHFDITEAFAGGKVATILIYETAAAGGYVKNPVVKVEMEPTAPELANPSFDENPSDVVTVTTQGYERNIPAESDQVAGMQPVTGWTPGIQTADDPGYTGGVFAYGSTNLLNNKVAAPAADPNGEDGVALGLAAVWAGVAQYTQEVTLPAGDYKFTYVVYNGANTGEVAKNLFGFIATDDTEYLSEKKSFTVGEWDAVEVLFTVDKETTGKISVGFIGSGGSGAAPHLFVDHVALTKVPGIDAAKAELQKAIEAAQAEVAKYTVGEDLFMYPASEIAPLNTAIATATEAYNDAEATKESLNTATETLNAFVAAFAPAFNAPDADKLYTFQLRLDGENPLYMNLGEGITIAEEATALKFIATENAGQYYLANEDETLFVGLAGGNAWTMSTAADKKAAWTFTALGEGACRINNLVTVGRFVGTNAGEKTEGSSCYADKQTSNGNVDWLIAEYVAPEPEPVVPTLANGDFEGEYTVYANPNADRAIYQPAGWTVSYENSDANDMTALNSDCLAWNNFENKPQLGETGGNNTYWVRFRWGDSETLTLSQQVNLTAGNYKLTADAFFNGADGASATISAAGQSTAITGNSTWANHKVVFTVTEEGPVTISLNVTQTKQVENIAAFDNVKLDTYDSMDEAKDELQAAITAAKAIETEGKVGVEELNTAITAAENALNDAEATEMSLVAAKAALNDAVAEFNDANITVPALGGWTRVRTADIENVADNYYVLVDANSLNYVISNEADHYRPCYKTVADPVANPSFVWTLEGSDNTFALKSFSTGAYFIAPSNGWDTSMTGSTGSATFQFTLNNGVYSIMCEQSKGLVGHWNDSGAAVANDGENIAANKQAKDAPGFYLFAMPKATYEAAILAARAEATAGASKETPIDVTEWIQNADWSGDFGGWARSGSWGNMQWGKQTLEVWNASDVVVKQTLTGVPDGTYKLTADVISGNDDNKVAYVFGIGGSTVNSDPVSAVASAGNYDTMSAEVAGNILTADNIVVTGGELTVGLNIAAGWVVADNFKLYYMGEDMDQYVDAYKKALAAAQAIDQESAMRADAKAALASALLSYAEVSETDKEALLAATSALNGAAMAAQASIAAYASAKSLLDDVDEVLANTNVYTAEAYETYTTAHATWTAKYEDGTLTDEEAASLRKDILPSRYNMGVDTWHWANTTDDFLLSAWTIDEVPAHEFDTKLYINMWSMEGYTDGSDFKVPFFEYWTGDGDSLGEATLKATISGLTAGETAEVDILVRVRAKNGVAAADATGITLQVNDGEPVDVTEGDVIGDSQFSVEKYTATGVIGEDGKLFIKLKVAAENNISWLSFKDVTYSLSTIPTAITDVKGVKNVGSIYDLSGRKVEKMVKGVYIVNGKKVSVK